MKHINIENIDIGLKMTLIWDESMICVQRYKKKCKKSVENIFQKPVFWGQKLQEGLKRGFYKILHQTLLRTQIIDVIKTWLLYKPIVS